MHLNKILQQRQGLLKNYDEEMYRIFTKIQNDVDQCLCFGPSNAKNSKLYNPSHFFRSNHSFQASNARRSSALLFQKLRNKSYVIDPNSPLLDDLALRGFWSGTGTCETYAIFGAVFLAKRYQVTVSIENIHSELTHTYLRVHTKPHEYIFDFWTRAMFRHKDWIEWNETVDYEYRYTEESYFSTTAHKLRPSALNHIFNLLSTDEHKTRRENHLQSVISSQREPDMPAYSI